MAQLNLNVTFCIVRLVLLFSCQNGGCLLCLETNNNVMKTLSVSMSEETPHDRRPAVVPEVTLSLSCDGSMSTSNSNIPSSECPAPHAAPVSARPPHAAPVSVRPPHGAPVSARPLTVLQGVPDPSRCSSECPAPHAAPVSVRPPHGAPVSARPFTVLQ